MFENWSKKDIRTAIKLYSEGQQVKNIASQVSRSYHATTQILVRWATDEVREVRKAVIASRITATQQLRSKNKEARDKVENLRMACYANGDTDLVASEICGVAVTTYIEWRKNRNLPTNLKDRTTPEEYELRRYDLKPAVHKERITLNNNDVKKYYKHNDNTPLAYNFIGSVNVIIPANTAPLLAAITDLTDQGRVTARRIRREAERKSYVARDEINNLYAANL